MHVEHARLPGRLIRRNPGLTQPILVRLHLALGVSLDPVGVMLPGVRRKRAERTFAAVQRVEPAGMSERPELARRLQDRLVLIGVAAQSAERVPPRLLLKDLTDRAEQGRVR